MDKDEEERDEFECCNLLFRASTACIADLISSGRGASETVLPMLRELVQLVGGRTEDTKLKNRTAGLAMPKKESCNESDSVAF